MARKPLSDEEKVRRNQKLLDMTLTDLEIAIDEAVGTFDGRASVRGIRASVRVIVRVRAPILQKWAMSIVYNDRGRIDGIDWEGTVKDHRGKSHNCSGWHRHMWKPETLDTHKECLPDFNPPHDIKAFLEEGFKVLNVQLKKGVSANANRKLPLN